MVKFIASKLVGAAAILSAAAGQAEVISIEAVMMPQEQIRLEFQDGSGHFVLMVRREGTAEGSGPLAGASVTEHGWHDIQTGIGGDSRGYLTFDAADGLAYVAWRVRAVFIRGPHGGMRLLVNGYWEVVSATGSLEGLQGAGTLHITPAPAPAAAPDRLFSLEGVTSFCLDSGALPHRIRWGRLTRPLPFPSSAPYRARAAHRPATPRRAIPPCASIRLTPPAFWDRSATLIGAACG